MIELVREETDKRYVATAFHNPWIITENLNELKEAMKEALYLWLIGKQ